MSLASSRSSSSSNNDENSLRREIECLDDNIMMDDGDEYSSPSLPKNASYRFNISHRRENGGGRLVMEEYHSGDEDTEADQCIVDALINEINMAGCDDDENDCIENNSKPSARKSFTVITPSSLTAMAGTRGCVCRVNCKCACHSVKLVHGHRENKEERDEDGEMGMERGRRSATANTTNTKNSPSNSHSGSSLAVFGSLSLDWEDLELELVLDGNGIADGNLASLII
jgi:hypothetical protein